MERRKSYLLDKISHVEKEVNLAVQLVQSLWENTKTIVQKTLEDQDSQDFLKKYPAVHACITENLDFLVEFTCSTEARIAKCQELLVANETVIGLETNLKNLQLFVSTSADSNCTQSVQASTYHNQQVPVANCATATTVIPSQSLNCADDVKLSLLDSIASSQLVSHLAARENDLPPEDDIQQSSILHTQIFSSNTCAENLTHTDNDILNCQKDTRTALLPHTDDTEEIVLNCSALESTDRTSSLSSSHISSSLNSDQSTAFDSSSEVSNNYKYKEPFSSFVENPGSVEKFWCGMLGCIETPSEFYVHIEHPETGCIDEFYNKFQTYFNNNKTICYQSKVLAQAKIGNFCACYHPDYKAWYRGQVLDWCMDNEEVIVQLVDYGHKYAASLQMLQQLPEEFTDQPLFAIRCHLAYIKPPTGMLQWPLASIKAFQECNTDILYNMIPVGAEYVLTSTTKFNVINHCKSVAIVLSCSDNTKIINDYLVEKVCAVYVDSGDLESSAQCTLDDYNLDQWDPLTEAFENPHYDDENACIAVLGYDPKDEQRICSNFARTGRCVKGNSCKKEHSLQNPTSHTSDKDIVTIGAFHSLNKPAKGSCMKMEVTCVLQNSFYAIESPSVQSSDPDSETLLTLVSSLNDPTNIRHYKRLPLAPPVGETVVAQFQTDKRWYRAKVVDSKTETGIIKVFFVDYGNTDEVPEKYVRCIEQKFLHLPFQAQKFVLSNIRFFENKIEAAQKYFHSIVSNKVLTARIVSSSDLEPVIYCLLTDEHGTNIGVHMKREGFGSLCDHSSFMHLGTSVKLPG